MSHYYVHTHPDNQGDHEVHKEGCSHMLRPENREYLGDFSHCSYAIVEARKHHSQVNGCFFCCRECHTS